MADAHIILAHSRDTGIVALAGGEQYRWAHTALEKSGFRRGAVGPYRPATNAPDAARATVAELIPCAERHRSSVSTSSRRYIGDTARDIARMLPGQCDTAIEIYSHPVWQEDLVPWLWDSGELVRAVQSARIPYAATLTDTSGTTLLIVEHPGHQLDYLLGAFTPESLARTRPRPRPRVIVPGAFLTVVVACAYVTTDALTPTGRTSEAYAWLILSIGVGQAAGTALTGRLADHALVSAALPAAGAAFALTVLLLARPGHAPAEGGRHPRPRAPVAAAPDVGRHESGFRHRGSVVLP